MWKKSHTIISKEVTKEQLWKLFSDVNQWGNWDEGIEFANMDGLFVAGNHFMLRPNGGPTVKIKILIAEPNKQFKDLTTFPLAKMYGDHIFEETADGLKMTTTMTVKGILGFLWIKLVARKIVDSLPADMQRQIEIARAL